MLTRAPPENTERALFFVFYDREFDIGVRPSSSHGRKGPSRAQRK
jgi:hypothetical protein